jgi:hypothetical protein
MAGVEAASSLLSTSTDSDLAAADQLYRTFRAAAARGEEACLSLSFREGKAGADLKLGAAVGPPVAAAQPAVVAAPASPAAEARPELQPAAAHTGGTPPPAGGRRGPRSRRPGALLRDERRRFLRIAPDVLGRTGWGGRCAALRPPLTVYRPALLAPALPALDPGLVEQDECVGVHCALLNSKREFYVARIPTLTEL